MKKSVAVAGASAMGLGMAVAGALPAQAADVTTPCTTVDDHVITNGTLADNWFMDCVPQYGLGKVGFTITAAEPFPSTFLPLDDPGVASEYSADAAAAAAYVGAPAGEPAGFADFHSLTDSQYLGSSLIVPITGVQSILPSALPAACAPTTNVFEHAYRVDYAPTTVTFSQTIDDEVWEFPVTFVPQPVFLGLNFDGVDSLSAAGGLDATAPQCLVLNNENVFAQDSTISVDEFAQILSFAGTAGDPSDLFPASGDVVFGFILDDVPAEITPVPDPVLAETGVTPVVAGTGLFTGFLALLSGLGLSLAARRRRREA